MARLRRCVLLSLVLGASSLSAGGARLRERRNGSTATVVVAVTTGETAEALAGEAADAMGEGARM